MMLESAPKAGTARVPMCCQVHLEWYDHLRGRRVLVGTLYPSPALTLHTPYIPRNPTALTSLYLTLS
jgi:hypothetical protein